MLLGSTLQRKKNQVLVAAQKYIGSFVLQASATNTDQYLALIAYDVPAEAEYYIINNAGQTLSAGWTLKVTPRTYKPA